MKTKNLLVLLFILLSTEISAQNNTITGFLRYDNNIQSLITDSTVVHLYQGNVSVYSVNVNNDGSYVFNDIPDGTYTLKAPWASQTFTLVVSGGNAYTQDIKLLCTGDVNGSYQPN